MAIIKNYTNWLAEAAAAAPAAKTAAAAPPAGNSLLPDLLAGAPFNKWSVSTAKKGFVIFPSWQLSPNKAEWWIPVEGYAFIKSTNSSKKVDYVMGIQYTETFGAFLPAGHPSEKNHSDVTIGGGTEVNTYNFEGNPAPAEANLAAIAQKYPKNADGTAWNPKEAVAGLGPNAVLAKSMQTPVDAFYTYQLMTEKEPTLSPDAFLDMLDRAMPGAKVMLCTQIKAGLPLANGHINDDYMKKGLELVNKVKTLPEFAQAPGSVPAGSPTAPGTAPAPRTAPGTKTGE